MAFLGQLKLNRDPFARDGIAPMGPVRAAFEQLMRHVELGTAIILIVGPGGSGKTFLLGIAEESCRTRGISVLRIERGDLAHTVIGKHVDLLLVDEADFRGSGDLEFHSRPSGNRQDGGVCVPYTLQRRGYGRTDPGEFDSAHGE